MREKIFIQASLEVCLLGVASATEYTECWPCPLLLFCSISIFLLASLVAGRNPSVILVQNSRECTPPYLSTGIKAPASPGRSRVEPALYVFSLLGVSLACLHTLYSMYSTSSIWNWSEVTVPCLFLVNAALCILRLIYHPSVVLSIASWNWIVSFSQPHSVTINARITTQYMGSEYVQYMWMEFTVYAYIAFRVYWWEDQWWTGLQFDKHDNPLLEIASNT